MGAIEHVPESCASADELSSELARLRSVVNETGGDLQKGRKWNESEHQRYIDFSTEVATLKEMSARELKERQDATRQHVSELEDAAKRFGELKSSLKTFRDHVRRRGASTDEGDSDIRQL